MDENRADVRLPGFQLWIKPLAIARNKDMIDAMRRKAFICFFTAFFLFSHALHAADDTFSCFTEFNGPVIKTFSGDQGYANYTLAADFSAGWANESRIDARGSIWRQEHLSGGTKPSRAWLVILGGNWKHPPKKPLCWVGGRFIGSTPLDASYNFVKRNAGEAITFNSDGGIIDGVRIHNIHEDSIGVTGDKTSRKPHEPTTIKDTWISHNSANAIENDRIKNMILDDIMIDGSHHPISVDPGSTYDGNREEEKNLIVISNSLIRNKFTENSEFDGRLKYNNFIKARAPWPVPQFKVYNTVFAAEGWPDTYSIKGGPPLREKLFRDNIIDCKNNLLLWLPDSPVPPPDVFPLEPKHCFKLVKGKEARNIWAAAKRNWINCHPKVGRAPGDPESNPSQCDPNAYGGGGSGSPSSGPGPCHLLTSSQSVPQGFGASYNPFSVAKELLLNVECGATSNATLSVGNSQNTMYVYRFGYEWVNGGWKQIALGGEKLVANDWYVGSAKASLLRSQQQLTQDNFVVAYTCLWQNNAWKCGCRDQSCTQSHWQLQAFRK